MSHKFSLGQAVVFTPGYGEVLTTATEGTITRLLPKEGVEYQYHVQINPDGPGRLAREAQLRAVPENYIDVSVRSAASPRSLAPTVDRDAEEM